MIIRQYILILTHDLQLFNLFLDMRLKLLFILKDIATFHFFMRPHFIRTLSLLI